MYELAETRDTLLRWLPPDELEELVRHQRARPAVLSDFPDGLEVFVTPRDADRFERRYGFELKPEPRLVWRAFDVLRSKIRRFPRWGFLRREFLDDLARQVDALLKEQSVESRLPHIPPPPCCHDVERVHSRPRRYWVDRQRRVDRRIRREVVNQVRLPEFDPKIPLEDQWFSKVKMSEGEKVEVGFVRLAAPPMPRGDGR